MNIKPATELDFAVICELYRALEAHHAQILPDRVKSNAGQERSFEDILSYIGSGEKVIFLARDGKTVIGFANLAIVAVSESISRVARRFAHLDNMYVLPESRGSGVATALLNECVNWCAQRGITNIELQVYNANRNAFELYESLGFRPYMTRMELQVIQSYSSALATLAA